MKRLLLIILLLGCDNPKFKQELIDNRETPKLFVFSYKQGANQDDIKEHLKTIPYNIKNHIQVWYFPRTNFYHIPFMDFAPNFNRKICEYEHLRLGDLPIIPYLNNIPKGEINNDEEWLEWNTKIARLCAIDSDLLNNEVYEGRLGQNEDGNTIYLRKGYYYDFP